MNLEAAETAEQATHLISWVLNLDHRWVQSIFNESQAETSVPPGRVLAFPVANTTWWTTHLITFNCLCLCDLKDPLQKAVIPQKQDIIDAQVDAKKNHQKKQKLEDDAIKHCDLINDGTFWHSFKSVINDLEPICFRLNMNQTNAMHPDYCLQVYPDSKHPIASGMMKQIKKRWKALNHHMFILALVPNPFKRVSYFRERDSVSQFTLKTIVLKASKINYSYCSILPTLSLDVELCLFAIGEDSTLWQRRTNIYTVSQKKREKEVSEAFMSYLTSKDPFKDWERNKESFQCVHVNLLLCYEKITTHKI